MAVAHIAVGLAGRVDGAKTDVEWNDRPRLVLGRKVSLLRNLYMFLGCNYPADVGSLSIACELNPPEKDINRQCAGLFLRDTEGIIYVAHSGKIGGGRKGIGKSAFLSTYRGARESVTWPDGTESEVIVIGRVDGDRLPAQVANFTRRSAAV